MGTYVLYPSFYGYSKVVLRVVSLTTKYIVQYSKVLLSSLATYVCTSIYFTLITGLCRVILYST